MRGLGGAGKVGVVKKMVRENNIQIMGLMETKAISLKEGMIGSLWGANDFKWEVINAVNSGGGLLCV